MEAVFENGFCNLQIYLSFFKLSNRIQNEQELKRVASMYLESLCGCNLRCVNRSIIWVSSDKHSRNSYSSLCWHKAVSDTVAKYCKFGRLKHRNVNPSARETGKESSFGKTRESHGKGWLTSTKSQVWTEEKSLSFKAQCLPQIERGLCLAGVMLLHRLRAIIWYTFGVAWLNCREGGGVVLKVDGFSHCYAQFFCALYMQAMT